MACTSGSVKTVADKTLAAKKQINKLQEMLQAQENDNKTKFYDEIKSHLTDAKITDAREISYNSYIKTEYTSEFSLDKIAAVVISALKAATKATDPTVQNPATSKDAISAYTDVVNSVAEAAKSSSTSAASLSFSMNRLSRGTFAFLYAKSVNIKDVDTFGTEVVTSTAIYYRLIESIDDLKNESAFGQAIIDAKYLLKMKMLQAALTDELSTGAISIDDWMKKDANFSKAIAVIQKRLDDQKFNTSQPFVLTAAHGFGKPISHSFVNGSAANQEVVRSAIQRLSTKGEEYKFVIETSEARLTSKYY